MQVAIVGADPDRLGILGRFGDGIDRRVHFRRRIVDGHPAALLLLLLFRIIGGQGQRYCSACDAWCIRRSE